MPTQRKGLRYVGPGRVSGVPAQDLSPAAIDRVVYVRTIPRPGSRGLRPGDAGYTSAHRTLLRELVTSGKYAKED